MSVTTVRTLLGDIPKFSQHSATGNNATKTFVVSSTPMITGSTTVTVDGAVKTLTTDYTLDVEAGLVEFVTAPGDNAPVIITFKYAQLSDESITTFLAINSDVMVAAAIAADSLAGKYAELVDKSMGDLSISYSQKSKAYKDMAKQFRAASRQSQSLTTTSIWAGGISISDKDSREEDDDRTTPAFTRELHTNKTD